MGEGDLAAPYREHLEALARQGDEEAIAELEGGPELPRLAAHLWDSFLDLSRTRGSGGMGGPAPISRHDIRQWEQDECLGLEPWERRAVLSLDRAWLNDQAEAYASKKGR